MLPAIVLTAILTAATVMALSYRGRSYVYNLEQQAMNQAEELVSLRLSVRRYKLRVENDELNLAGARAALTVERIKVRSAEQEAHRAHNNAAGLAMRLALAEARAPELHIVDHPRDYDHPYGTGGAPGEGKG